jgi:hypothetical protein
MMFCLNDVLTPAEARDIRGRLRTIRFADGTKTAGVFARAVKRNEQAEAGLDTAKLQEAQVLPSVGAQGPSDNGSRLVAGRVSRGQGWAGPAQGSFDASPAGGAFAP